MQNVKLRSRFRLLANRCAFKLPGTGAHLANELGRPHQPRRPRTRERHRAGDRSDPSRVRYLWNDPSFSWPSAARGCQQTTKRKHDQHGKKNPEA